MKHFFTHTLFAVLVSLTGLMLAGCSDAEAPRSTELQSAAVVRLLAGTRTEAPGVQSTHAYAIAVGQPGGLGPTDYDYVGMAQLSVQALPEWLAAWRPLETRPGYVKPEAAVSQWPSAEAFAQLEFFVPRDPAPGQDGWIALDRKLVRVYFDFSTR